ncbi:hypothetical protein OSTOST_13540, partial [Ostertagia ostertagi]
MCDCLKLYQVVSEGTHGSNILDLVLTNNKEVVKDVVIRAPIGSSDHASVLFKLDLKIEEVVKLSLRRDFKKANFNDILTYLTNHEHLPQHLERLSRKKNSLWKKAVVSDSPAAWEAYKRISCIFEKRLYKFRSQVEKKIIYSRNKNNLYRFLSTRLGKKKALGILLDENGVVITSEKEKAELFAAVFHKVYLESDGIAENKNNLYRFLSTRLGKKKALGILLDENGVVITSEKEKAELFAAVFHKVYLESDGIAESD